MVATNQINGHFMVPVLAVRAVNGSEESVWISRSFPLQSDLGLSPDMSLGMGLAIH